MARDTTVHISRYWCDMICVVYAYLAIEKGWVDRNQRRYYMINLDGAALLTISLLFSSNLGSFLLKCFGYGFPLRD